MENFLLDYLEKADAGLNTNIEGAGPVITISRECGCSANHIAKGLSKILTGYSSISAGRKKTEWKWMNKEVIEEVANELQLTPERVKSVFLKDASTNLNELQSAFSAERVYDSEDEYVIETVRKVIGRISIAGNCVIVGRGANIIAADIPERLSVKLYAPLEWRIKQIMNVSSMNYADSRDYVQRVDRQRDLFVSHMAGREIMNIDYDVAFNYATLQPVQIINNIISLLKSKEII
ncbi:MAG: cytidylate kinase-like family protein [Prolixibacteraceae bacterium]|nr:cytidylate kinase-like family protein [Prolixibacteraceae bacterium]